MEIGAVQKFSLIDYPGKVCAIVFTLGCNFRCPYCHNPELVLPELYSQSYSQDELFTFLEKRRGKLDAVSITGGEPTLHADVVPFIKRLKEMDYLVKLDTNGSRPDVIQELIGRGYLDYIAMDVKAPLSRYPDITRVPVSPDDITASIEAVINSNIDYEFRTTVVRTLLGEDDLLEIASVLLRGAKTYILQKFVPSKLLNPSLADQPVFTEADLLKMKAKLEKKIAAVFIR